MFKTNGRDEAKEDHRLASLAVRGLSFVTGALIYMVIHMFIDPKYLNPDSINFQEDITILIALAIVFVIISIIWASIHYQFKKDRTKLGFPLDRSGGSVLAEIIVEMLIGPLIIFLF